MRAIKIVFLILFIICSFAAPVYAENFIEVALDGNDLVIYLDIDSIEHKGNYIAAWTKGIMSGELLEKAQIQIGSSISKIMSFYAFNPMSKESQALSWVYYNNEGKEFRRNSWPFSRSRFQAIDPGSTDDLLYQATMRYLSEPR